MRVRIAALACLLAVASATTARAQVSTLLGRAVASVTIEEDGRPLADPQTLSLVETRVGAPLAMSAVRETIVHLFTLGRVEDVRVNATPQGDGVALVYELVPVRRIDRVDFRGRVALSSRQLRAAVFDRVGAGARVSRAGLAVEALREQYREFGYFAPKIEPVLEPGGRGESTLVFDIDAGPRAVVGDVTVNTDTGDRAAVVRRLELTPGTPWNRPAVVRRADALVEDYRRDGYYEADVQVRESMREGGGTVDVVAEVSRGPRITLVFEGDPVPEAKQRELVPISRENVIDEDLLEDSKRRLEAWLAGQGYWRAAVDYTRRAEENAERVVFTIRKGLPAVVDRLEFTGVERAPRAELEAALQLKPGAPFVQGTLDADRAALAVFYQRRGFATVAVETSVSRGDAPAAGTVASGEAVPLVVRFTVREGPETRVGAIDVEGASSVQEGTLRGLMALKPGDAYYAPSLRADIDRLTAAYLDRGYRQVSVQATPRFDEARTSVEIRYAIVEGPVALVDDVIVVGNDRTSTATIMREAQVGPGRPASVDALAETQRRLGALGLFRRVRVEDRLNPDGRTRDVVITVEEAPATTLGYGFGVEVQPRFRQTETGAAPADRVEFAPRGFVEIGRRNLWGKNRSVNLYARASFRDRGTTDTGGGTGYGVNEYRVVGAYREPRVFALPFDAQVSAVAEQAIRTGFSFRRQALNVDAIRRVRPTLTLNARYAFGRTELYDEQFNPSEQPLIDRLFPQVRLSILSGAGVHDLRDDPLDPSRGRLVSVEGQLATRAIGSEVGFVKTLMQGFMYHRIPGTRRVVFAGGARLGLATGFTREVTRADPDGTPLVGADGQPVVDFVKDLPASERFYAGGDTTVRGFSLDRLGPLDQDGFPTGGNALVIFNAEMRVPVWKSLGAVAFLDAGNVFTSASDLSLADLRGGAGVGIRYKSPVGPLRIDVGFKLDRQVVPSGARERPYVVHVSIGQAF